MAEIGADVIVRPAVLADVDQLVELRGQMFQSMGIDRPGAWEVEAARWFSSAVRSDRVSIVVAAQDGRVHSCAMGELYDGAPSPGHPSGHKVHISNVVTRPEARHRGLAGQCLGGVLAWAHAQAPGGRVELHATEDGRGLYERHGFRVAANPSMQLRVDDAGQ